MFKVLTESPIWNFSQLSNCKEENTVFDVALAQGNHISPFVQESPCLHIVIPV